METLEIDCNAVPILTMSPAPNSSPFETRNLTLLNGPMYIGRTDGMFRLGSDTFPNSSNGFFTAGTVSRKHAKVHFQSGRFWIQDLKSSHGTKINGDRLDTEPHILRDDDIVSFGKAGFVGNVEQKPVFAQIKLKYPTYDSLVPASEDQFPAKADHSPTEKERSLDKTASIEDLIAELEGEESPRSKRKLEGLREALDHKRTLNISTKAAVLLVPKLLEF